MGALRYAACLALALGLPAAAQNPADEAERRALIGVQPRYLLMDHTGRARSDEDFRGRFQLIAFGYTTCPDVCPTTLVEMQQILAALGDDAQRLQPIFITVDPERDTAELLRNYVEFFDKRIIGLTGSPDLVRRAADRFKVRYQKVREPGAPPERYAMDHSAGMYLVGPDGVFITKFAYATPVQQLIAGIKQAMKIGR